MKLNFFGDLNRLLFGISLYILFLIFSLFINNGLVSLVVSFFPVLLLSYIVIFNVKDISSWSLSKHEVLIIYFLFFGGVSHILLSPYFYFVDYLKFIFIFILYFIGLKQNKSRPVHFLSYFIPLWVVPCASLLVYLFSSIILGSSNEPVIFFSNRNNAAGYVLASLLVFWVMCGNTKKFTLISIAFLILFNTLGILIAFFASIFLSKLKFSVRNLFLILFASSFTIAVFVYSDLAIVERLRVVFYGINSFLASYSLSEISSMSFGDFVALQDGSSDISLFFRLKHWAEILFLILSQPMYLFSGWGMNASQTLTSMNLVPHNDWLRVIFELGVLNFIAFFILNVSILAKINRSEFVFIVVMSFNVYFFSENIINNFLITSFLYYTVGVYLNNENIKYRP